jgi:hypothetical protein
MKKLIQCAGLLLCLAASDLQLSTAFAQGTAFTYQGRLNSGGAPANGTYDLLFSLYNVSTNGLIYAGPLTNSATAVSNGLFTVTLDFGPGIFTGPAYWLDISVRTNGGGTFTELTPRQPLLPTPYAIMANSASNLLGTLLATQLTGTIPASQLSGTIASSNLSGSYNQPVTFNNGQDQFYGDFFGSFFGSTFQGGTFTGQFMGDGSGLVNINPAHINGQIAFLNSNQVFTAQNVFMQPVGFGNPNPSPFFQLDAMGGQGQGRFITTNNASGSIVELRNLLAFPNEYLGAINFNNAENNYPGQIGYIQSNPTNENFDYFEFRVGGFPGLTIQADPRGDAAANIIGGFYGNSISPFGSGGDVIAGGGLFGIPNTISSNSSGVFIGAGSDNQIAGANDNTVIVGGQNNSIGYNTQGAFIGAGTGNTIEFFSGFSSIPGGIDNTIETNSGNSFIGGGSGNIIQPTADHATIAGGYNNEIQTNAWDSAIDGGYGNIIQPFAEFSGIGGGNLNTNGASYSLLGSGEYNWIQSGSFSFLGGGVNNQIGTNNYADAIAGGNFNVMQPNVYYSFIGSGIANSIQGYDFCSVIAGGDANTIVGDSNYWATFFVYGSSIGGGAGNQIQTNSPYATIAGGIQNVLGPNGNWSVIGGGVVNSNASPFSTIAGGSGNIIFANIGGAAIGGGNDNVVSGTNGTVPGGFGNQAGGAQSFAAGTEAQATNDGAFVLADDEFTNFYSTTSNQLSARFTGGIRFVTAGAGMTLDGQSILSGIVNPGQLSGKYTNTLTLTNTGNIFAGNGTGLTNVNAALLNGLTTNAFAPASGSTNYIQNQSLGMQNASFQIGGSALIGGAVSASNVTAASSMTTSNLQINGGVFQVLGAGSNTTTTAFIQWSTAANVSGDHTIINNPLCNGDPNAILIVTHNYNPGNTGSFVVWNHVMGTFYTGGQWTIYNEDETAMASNVAFNVLIVKH